MQSLDFQQTELQLLYHCTNQHEIRSKNPLPVRGKKNLINSKHRIFTKNNKLAQKQFYLKENALTHEAKQKLHEFSQLIAPQICTGEFGGWEIKQMKNRCSSQHKQDKRIFKKISRKQTNTQTNNGHNSLGILHRDRSNTQACNYNTNKINPQVHQSTSNQRKHSTKHVIRIGPNLQNTQNSIIKKNKTYQLMSKTLVQVTLGNPFNRNKIKGSMYLLKKQQKIMNIRKINNTQTIKNKQKQKEDNMQMIRKTSEDISIYSHFTAHNYSQNHNHNHNQENKDELSKNTFSHQTQQTKQNRIKHKAQNLNIGPQLQKLKRLLQGQREKYLEFGYNSPFKTSGLTSTSVIH